MQVQHELSDVSLAKLGQAFDKLSTLLDAPYRIALSDGLEHGECTDFNLGLAQAHTLLCELELPTSLHEIYAVVDAYRREQESDRRTRLHASPASPSLSARMQRAVYESCEALTYAELVSCVAQCVYDTSHVALDAVSADDGGVVQVFERFMRQRLLGADAARKFGGRLHKLPWLTQHVVQLSLSDHRAAVRAMFGRLAAEADKLTFNDIRSAPHEAAAVAAVPIQLFVEMLGTIGVVGHQCQLRLSIGMVRCGPRPIPLRPIPLRPIPLRPIPLRPITLRPIPLRPIPLRPIPLRPIPLAG